MALKRDPYLVLGIPRGAKPEEVRRAYHRAVLHCHPDQPGGDAPERLERFHEVKDAYEAILRPLPTAVPPKEFARTDAAWLVLSQADAETVEGRRTRDGLGMVKMSRPTRDEPAVFLLFWLLAIALSTTVAYFWIESRFAGRPGTTMGEGELGLIVVVTLAIYLGVTAATYLVLLRSREIFWLALWLGRAWRRALPGPRDDRQLPR